MRYNYIEVESRSGHDDDHPITIIIHGDKEEIEIYRHDRRDLSTIKKPELIAICPADLWDAVKAWQDKQKEDGLL